MKKPLPTCKEGWPCLSTEIGVYIQKKISSAFRISVSMVKTWVRVNYMYVCTYTSDWGAQKTGCRSLFSHKLEDPSSPRLPWGVSGPRVVLWGKVAGGNGGHHPALPSLQGEPWSSRRWRAAPSRSAAATGWGQRRDRRDSVATGSDGNSDSGSWGGWR